jgi:hypothetical protein
MRTISLTAAFVLMSFALSLAQPAAASPAPPPKDHEYRGCLRGEDGNFRLAMSSGHHYQLAGDKSQLKNLTDKEVMIKGYEGSASDVSTGMSGPTGEATSNPTAGTEPTIRVDSATKVSDQCNQH